MQAISNLQSEISNLMLVVGVGIEPTFAAFQTAANPSQLSNLNLASVERFELPPSAFVAQRSFVPTELHGGKRGKDEG